MRLDPGSTANAWGMPDVNCGLPMRDPGRFHPVDTVMADSSKKIIMAGGLKGVVTSQDEGVHYRTCSSQEFTDKVTLPETWLFVSGEHNLEVVNEDEAK
jgi:hypothetical protein